MLHSLVNGHPESQSLLSMLRPSGTRVLAHHGVRRNAPALRRHADLANTRPDHEHLVCRAVEAAHVAAREPFEGSREAVRGQWADRLRRRIKTDAGKRTVVVPPHVIPVLAQHMAEWAGPDRVFVGRDGRPMRGDAVRQAFNCARLKAGMPGFRFHDLRHTGQTLAAATGATVKDLMRRLGHASPVASYRYLHAVDGRDAEIAAALSELAAHGGAARLPKRSW